MYAVEYSITTDLTLVSIYEQEKLGEILFNYSGGEFIRISSVIINLLYKTVKRGIQSQFRKRKKESIFFYLLYSIYF